MTDLIEHEHVDESPVQADEEPVLTAKLHPRWAMGAVHVLVVALFGMLFMLLNYLPLRSTELLGDVMYGRWILKNGALPAQDPILPLADGMPVVDTTWLSQVILASVERYAGTEWLSHLFALTVLATFLVLGRIFYLQSRRPIVTILGVVAVFAVGFSPFTTMHPQNFTILCFACLMWLIVGSESSVESDSSNSSLQNSLTTRRPRAWRLWIGVPVLCALSANLHESFVWGLVALGCCFLGRVIEVGWQTRSLRAVLGDRLTRRWLYLSELGFAATLINPYGIDLWLRTFWFSPSAEDFGLPLVFLGAGGREFALSWVLLLVVLRHSRQRMPAAHVLLLGFFALATVFRTEMIVWYALVFGAVLVPHLAELAARLSPALAQQSPEHQDAIDQGELPPGRSWRYSLICVALIWIAFALSPISAVILPRDPRPPEQLFGKTTPLALTAYLRDNPPSGQVYHPYEWGDWLAWDGPEGLLPFVTGNVGAVPSQIWRDYRLVAQVRSGWQRVFTRYRIQTVILDKQQQTIPIQNMRREDGWRVAYEDRQAIVFAKTNAGGGHRSPPDPTDSSHTTHAHDELPSEKEHE
jgi:hypothetical protein